MESVTLCINGAKPVVCRVSQATNYIRSVMSCKLPVHLEVLSRYGEVLFDYYNGSIQWYDSEFMCTLLGMHNDQQTIRVCIK